MKGMPEEIRKKIEAIREKANEDIEAALWADPEEEEEKEK
jgi:hypothetical protein